MPKRLLALLVISGLTVFSSTAQVIIDSFDQGPFALAPTTSGDVVTTTGDPSSIAGGTRDVRIQFENNQFLPHSTASLAPGDSFLDYNRQQNGNLLLAYGGFVSTPMNIDATVGGADRITLTLSAAPGPVSMTLFVRDNSFFQNEQSATITGTGPGAYEWPFSSFPSVQFDKLGAVLLIVDSGVAPFNGPGDYRFASLVIPEPRIYALAGGSSLFVFAMARNFVRRRVR